MDGAPLNGLAGEALMTIARNVRRIAVFCLLVAVATSVYTLVVKPRFTATATAFVPGSVSAGIGSLAGMLPEAMGSGGLGSLLSSLPGEMGIPAGEDLHVVETVLASRGVRERLIIRYDLMRRWRARTMDDALKLLARRMSVTLTADGLFVITAQGETREEAASMARDIIEFANADLSTMVTSRARRARMEAEALLGVAADSLESAQGRMEEFRARTGLILPEEQGQAMFQALSQVEAELMLARSELSGATATLSPYSPTARELSATVASLEAALQGWTGYGDSTGAGAFPSMGELPADMREYEGLYLEVEMRRMVVLMLRQQLESLRIEEARDSPTIEVLEPPVAPKQRTFPKRVLMVGGFTVLAFIAACMWMTVVAYLRRVGRDPVAGTFWRGFLGEVRTQLRRGRARNG